MKKINLTVIFLTLFCVPINFFAGNCTSSAKIGASNNTNETTEPAPRRNQPVEQTYYPDSRDNSPDFNGDDDADPVNFEVIAALSDDQSQNNMENHLNDDCKTVVWQYNNQIIETVQQADGTTFKNYYPIKK